MTINIDKLKNGIRVVTEEIPSIESVSVGIWINVGSRNEKKIETLEGIYKRLIETKDKFNILCGDFNADPISDEIRTITGHKQPVSDVVLRDVWMITNPDDIGFTWSNDNHWAARTLEYNRRICLLYTSPSPRDRTRSRMPSSA